MRSAGGQPGETRYPRIDSHFFKLSTPIFTAMQTSNDSGESLKALTAYPLVSMAEDDETLSPDFSGGLLCCVEAGNPAYKRGRRFQLTQMIVLPFIPILALLVQTALTLHHLLQYRADMEGIETQVGFATDLGKLVTRMQLERSEVAFHIFTNGSTEPLRY